MRMAYKCSCFKPMGEVRIDNATWFFVVLGRTWCAGKNSASLSECAGEIRPRKDGLRCPHDFKKLIG